MLTTITAPPPVTAVVIRPSARAERRMMADLEANVERLLASPLPRLLAIECCWDRMLWTAKDIDRLRAHTSSIVHTAGGAR